MAGTRGSFRIFGSRPLLTRKVKGDLARSPLRFHLHRHTAISLLLTESSLIASNYSLVCATPEFYSVKGLQRLYLFINNVSERHGTKILGVVLSFWNTRGKSNDAFLK